MFRASIPIARIAQQRHCCGWPNFQSTSRELAASEEVAAAIIEGMKADKEEIIVGEAGGLYQAALRDPKATFKQLND
jgi:heterodisulfide reductase subunit B